MSATSERKSKHKRHFSHVTEGTLLGTDSFSGSEIHDNSQGHDALIIEYCPKVFRELRQLEDISGEELER